MHLNRKASINKIARFVWRRRHDDSWKYWCLLQVRCFKVVGSLKSTQNSGMSDTTTRIFIDTNAVIPRKTSQQAHTRLVTTLDLRQSFTNTASCQIST